MNIIIILLFILGTAYSSNSQDLIKEIQKLTLINDSLQKQVIKPLNDSISYFKNSYNLEVSKLNRKIDTSEKEIYELNIRVKKLEKENVELAFNKVKIENDSLQKQVGLLNVYLMDLKKQILVKEGQISDTKRIGEENASKERDKGRQELLGGFISAYKDKKFDDLLKLSTKQSVERDIQLIGVNSEVKTILQDLKKYFDAEVLLNNKIDLVHIKNTQGQINQIKQQSELLNKLKEKLGSYKIFNDGLKETIEKVIALDNREMVSGMGDAVQKQKFNKILSELTSFIFSYDFNFFDYPYLSDIFLEIVKRKQPNTDAEITDLLLKLQ